MTVPFTDDEIRAAVLLIGTDAEANAAVRGIQLGLSSGDGSLTQDTLILLSLVSRDLERRVDAYRAQGRLTRPSEAERAYLSRREEIRRLI